MGFPNYNIQSKISPADLERVTETLPQKPMLTDEEFQSIIRYYWREAPINLQIENQKTERLKRFQPFNPKFTTPFLTLLQVDTGNNQLLIGSQSSWLFKLDKSLRVKDSVQLESPPSHAVFKDSQITLSLLGLLMPNDQAKGRLVELNQDLTKTSSFIDSLQRAVFFHEEDLNNDGKSDFIICEYGNYTGFIAIFEGKEKGFVKHILASSPGARKVEVRDFNNDGRNDVLALFAQGDERLVLYLNQGNFSFEEKILVRFPPVYGCNYFEMIDFNNDGHLDILLTNGDNGDYSIILKPYHGIRIIENDGFNNFKESMFFPMPGASQATAQDFDKDGDLDIAAISFFPDFDNYPEEGFIYFENDGKNNFTPQTIEETANGRWLLMETWDYDEDGDTDIILGSSSYRGLGANNEIYKRWVEKVTPIMVLNNMLNPKK